MLTVADADGERRIPVRVTLIAPGLSTIDQPAAALPLESSDWHCWLPEVGLLCKSGRFKKDKELPSLKVLTDAEQARPLLEQALRAQAAGYEHVSICACAPELLLNKPAKSAIIRYKLDYGPEAAERGWRDTIILKAYGETPGATPSSGCAPSGMRVCKTARRCASPSRWPTSLTSRQPCRGLCPRSATWKSSWARCC